jgi:putative ABC transport system permease protein
MTILSSYSARSLWARRATSLATTMGIALTVFVLTGSRMLSTGMRGMMTRAGSDSRALVTQHEAYAESTSHVRQVMLTHAAAAPGVRRGPDGQPLVTGEVAMPLLVSRLDDAQRISAVQLRGVSGNVFAVRPEVRVVDGRPPHFGRDEAMIGKALASNYTGLTLGGEVTLRKGRRVAIVGVFEAQGSAYESEIWTGLDVVRTSMGWEGYLSSVTAVLDSKDALDGFATALGADHSLGVTAVSERAYYERISEGLARSVTTLGDLMTLIFACGAMLGAAITMNEAIARRRKEIGVLRALGFSAPDVMLTFMLEAAGLALVGAMLGVGLASLLSLGHFSMTNLGSGNEIAFPFEPRLGIMVQSLLLGAMVGVLGGFFPALEAARTDPVVAMRA